MNNTNPLYYLEEKIGLGTKISHFGRKMMKKSDKIGFGTGVVTGVGMTGIPLVSALAGNGSANNAVISMMGPSAGILTGVATPKVIYQSGRGIKSVGDAIRLRKIKNWLLKKHLPKKEFIIPEQL